MTRTLEQLTEEAKAARREYMREWYAAHPDRRRAHQVAYWNRKARAAREREEATRDAR